MLVTIGRLTALRPLLVLQLTALAACGSPTATSTTTPLAAPPRPLAMELLGTISEDAIAIGAEADLVVDGTTLYLPLGGAGLALYDLSDPRRPAPFAILGRAELGGQAGAVVAAGTRAFVATPDTGAIVELEVSTPARPRVVRRFGEVPLARALALQGSRLFVHATYGRAGVHAFDVSTNPPTLQGVYLADILDAGFAAAAPGTVFLAQTFPVTAIDVIDLAQPAAPRLLSHYVYPVPANIDDLDLRDGRLYCAAHWGGVSVLDASDPAHPRQVASFDWPDGAPYASRVRALPPYVFVARGSLEGDSRLQALRQEGSLLSLAWEGASGSNQMSIALAPNLLALGEYDYRIYRKTVRLYRIFQDA